MLYSYGVTPLKDDHFEERLSDIIEQVQTGVITMPLFMMVLVPEGNPVWDKVTPLCALFAKYRDRLAEHNIKCGVLIQASLGHGYVITENPFDKYIRVTDGGEEPVCCPDDPAFIEHFSHVIETIANAHPAAIMLDDDFRLLMRPGKGCACKRHMEKFHRLTGTTMTREELWTHLSTHKTDDISRAFVETQQSSLVNAARAFRAAIDRVDPSIQGINCTSGHICESVDKTNKEFAGKGNPTMVRVPNGIYAPITVRGFSDLMRQAAICGTRLEKRGIDIRLAETDTIPFNRYAKGARYLHSHYTASILEGLRGAKHWLTRTTAFEPKSGRAYRDILAQYHDFYEALIPISEDIKWVGINALFVEQPDFFFHRAGWTYHSCSFVANNLERMGLPFYYSEDAHGASWLGDGIVCDMSDAQLEAVFASCSVFVDGTDAKLLCDRGFGDKLGVDVVPYEGEYVKSESYTGELDICSTKQKNLFRIVPKSPAVREISHNVAEHDGNAVILSPAVTSYRRTDGKLSVVYCGSTDAYFNYMEGFAFLNESRKQQFIDLFREAGILPVYCAGDEEICFRAGYLSDGTLVAMLYELGIDPAEEISLYLEAAPTKMEYLQKDGTRAAVSFTDCGDHIYHIHLRLEPLLPVILFIS